MNQVKDQVLAITVFLVDSLSLGQTIWWTFMTCTVCFSKYKPMGLCTVNNAQSISFS